MPHVLIVADMVGVSGIETLEACTPEHPDYAAGTACLTAEVNVVAEAAFQAGATAVSVIDWHASGQNLRADLLDDRVQRASRDLSAGYDALFLIGFHAMSGVHPAFMSHTLAPGLALELNGQPVGELALVSHWAGEHGTPIALATGDRALTQEAECFLFETPTLTVKQARAWDRADSLPVARAHQVIGSEVMRVLRRPDRWRVYRTETPVKFRLRLGETTTWATKLPGLRQDDDGRFAGTAPTVKAVIDLVELAAMLMAADQQAALVAALQRDPVIAAMINRERDAALRRTAQSNPWP